MIRVSQMLLSQALFRIKISDYKHQGKGNQVASFNKKYGLLIKTLIMFMDNQIKISELQDTADFSTLIEDFDIEKDKLSVKEYYNKKVTPPFSIQNICSVGALFDKVPGKFYSEVNVVNIMEELVNNVNLALKLQVITFTEGIVYEKAIIDKCFKKVYWKCTCGDNTKVNVSNSIISKNGRTSSRRTSNLNLDNYYNEKDNEMMVVNDIFDKSEKSVEFEVYKDN